MGKTMTKGSAHSGAEANQIDVDGAGAGGKAAPEPFCGDFAMRIGRDGTWYYRDSPILRPALVKLFAAVLRRDAGGEYWLVTPVERGRIRVDDAPFTAVELTVEGTGREQTLRFRTNLDESVAAGPAFPLRVGGSAAAPRPYVLVRPGLEALILRPVYYELVERGIAGEGAAAGRFGVWSRGVFFALAPGEEGP